MKNTEILAKLQPIFVDVFDNQGIIVTEQTSASDIEEWDSLSNIELIVAIERAFSTKFNSDEIEKWRNVGDIVKTLSLKS